MNILKLSEENLIDRIKACLEKGQVLILPTDTVYGLICDASNKEAVDKIFDLKGRDFDKPIGVFVRDVEMVKQYGLIGQEQERIMEKYWPGKITFIIKTKKNLPQALFAGSNTIGIRIPDFQLIQDLFKQIDFPLAQTSANISGQPDSTKINNVLAQFKNKRPDLVADAGDLVEASASTVIDLVDFKVLRQGEVVVTELEK